MDINTFGEKLYLTENSVKTNENEKKIISFDIFYTLKWILYGEEYKSLPLNGDKNSGECLFKYINPKLRNCRKYKKLARSTCNC